MLKGGLEVGKFVKKSFLEHKATFVPGEPRDLMDSMCEEIAGTTDPTSSFYKEEGGKVRSFCCKFERLPDASITLQMRVPSSPLKICSWEGQKQ